MNSLWWACTISFLEHLLVDSLAMAIEAGLRFVSRHWSAFKNSVRNKKLSLEAQVVFNLFKQLHRQLGSREERSSAQLILFKSSWLVLGFLQHQVFKCFTLQDRQVSFLRLHAIGRVLVLMLACLCGRPLRQIFPECLPCWSWSHHGVICAVQGTFWIIDFPMDVFLVVQLVYNVLERTLGFFGNVLNIPNFILQRLTIRLRLRCSCHWCPFTCSTVVSVYDYVINIDHKALFTNAVVWS